MQLVKAAEKQGVFESIITSETLASAHREELRPNRANQQRVKPNESARLKAVQFRCDPIVFPLLW